MHRSAIANTPRNPPPANAPNNHNSEEVSIGSPPTDDTYCSSLEATLRLPIGVNNQLQSETVVGHPLTRVAISTGPDFEARTLFHENSIVNRLSTLAMNSSLSRERGGSDFEGPVSGLET